MAGVKLGYRRIGLGRPVNVDVDIRWNRVIVSGEELKIYRFFDRNNGGKEISRAEFLALWGIRLRTDNDPPLKVSSVEMMRDFHAVGLLRANLNPEYVAWAFEMPVRWAEDLNREMGRQLRRNGKLLRVRADGRKQNGKKPLFTAPEVVAFVKAELDNNPSLTGPAVAALVAERFGFAKVPRQRGAELLALVRRGPSG